MSHTLPTFKVWNSGHGQILYGYTRKHCPGNHVIPEIISLIAQFFSLWSLWQKFVLTENQCNRLLDTFRYNFLMVLLRPFSCGQFRFECRLMARCCSSDKDKLSVKIEIAFPDHIDLIGGYFGCRRHGEKKVISYRCQRRKCEGKCWMTISHLFPSKAELQKGLSFSQYLDIRRIQSKYGRESIDIMQSSSLGGDKI